MKRLLMLKPLECGSGDTKKNKIYDVIEDKWLVWQEGNFQDDVYEYTKENTIKYSEGTRWINIKDESSTDSFEVHENEDRFIIIENNKELAHILIDRIEGLDAAVVNMALSFNNK